MSTSLGGDPFLVEFASDAGVGSAGAPAVEDAADGFEFGGDRHHAMA